MTSETGTGWRQRLAAHVSQSQHRNAYYLLLNTVTGAAAGLVFWVFLARFAALPAESIGLGYAVVALGTTVAVIAKGGLDLAILRTVPGAGRREGGRILTFSILLGAAAAILLTGGVAVASFLTRWVAHYATLGWALVGAIGVLLVATWLQDAYFLAEGQARLSFHRNLVFSAARLLLPFLIVLLALPHPVALSWALALAVSAGAAVFFMRRLPRREGRLVPRREFLRSATRNISGSAAEFLPGLLLAPLVLALDGPAGAAYFGIAWTAASMLFVVSAAISRAALAEMVRNGGTAAAIRRSVQQHVVLVLPAAVAGAALAPYLLRVFGPDYAANGAPVMALLCASILVIAPAYLYLAVLRARERPLPLLLFPAAMVGAQFLLVPLLESRLGLVGVAVAWLAANAPFGVYAAWKLRALAREVKLPGTTPSVHRATYVE